MYFSEIIKLQFGKKNRHYSTLVCILLLFRTVIIPKKRPATPNFLSGSSNPHYKHFLFPQSHKLCRNTFVLGAGHRAL